MTKPPSSDALKEPLIFSPYRGIFKRMCYIALRMFYLCAIGSAFPLALMYWKKTGAAFSSIPAWAGWIIAVGSLFWSLLYIGLEQYGFSLRLRGALITVFSFILNAGAGTALASYDPSYGAYQAVMASVTAQSLFLTGIIVYFLAPRELLSVLKIKKGDADTMARWYYLFLAIAAGSLAVVVFMMGRPLTAELLGEPNIVRRIGGIAAFTVHVISNMKTLREGSIFAGNDPDHELRNRLHDSWAGFTAIGIMGCLISAAIIAFRGD